MYLLFTEEEISGKVGIDWTPDLEGTDSTLVYATFTQEDIDLAHLIHQSIQHYLAMFLKQLILSLLMLMRLV